MDSRNPIAGVVAVVALVCAAAPLSASFPATEVFLPSVGRGDGAAGSQWYTAMWVHNPTSSTANVQIFFLRRDQANPFPEVFNLAVEPADGWVPTGDPLGRQRK